MPRLKIENLSVLSITCPYIDLEAGTCAAVTGPSGSGKSVFLKAVADLIPHFGEIYLDQKAQSAFFAPDWRKSVGLLPAESRWWAPAVEAHFEDGATDLLFDLGFEASVLSWPVSRLSSGERQRLALARLLSREPAALLLDEPTANLDEENALLVETLVAKYQREKKAPVIWVSHHMSQVKRVAGRHFRFEGSNLTEETAP